MATEKKNPSATKKGRENPASSVRGKEIVVAADPIKKMVLQPSFAERKPRSGRVATTSTHADLTKVMGFGKELSGIRKSSSAVKQVATPAVKKSVRSSVKRPEKFVVTSAEQAWSLLKEVLDGRPLSDDVELQFKGWPNFSVRIEGKDWNSTVPSRVMTPLLEVQKDIYRVLMKVRHGDSNLRRLTNEDRDALEIIVKVKKGSADYQAPLDGNLSNLASEAMKNMSSRDRLILLLGVALVYGSIEINKAWIAMRQAEVQAQTTVELSKQETARMEVFGNAMARMPAINEVKEDHEASASRILKTAKPADTIHLPGGIALSGIDASELVETERARSEDIDLKGKFRILRNDVSDGASFQIKVARLSDGLVFVAKVPVELPDDQKQLIKDAEWSLGKQTIELHISASILHGNIHNAEIYSAKRS